MTPFLQISRPSYLPWMVREKSVEFKDEAVAVVAGWVERIAKTPEVGSRSKWARAAGVSDTTVTRGMARTSESTPKIENLHALARAAGIPSVLDFLENQGADTVAEVSTSRLNEDNLVPLLNVLLPLAPSGRATEQSLRALSSALAHGIELLGNRVSSPASEDALAVAARGAVVRFREIISA